MEPLTLAPPYTYTAVVVRVIDGDTLIADIDLGFGVWLREQSYRLVGCNAIEKSQPGGRQARDNLAALLPAGTVILLSSVRNDKYGGRYDARVATATIPDLAEHLIATGWAQRWNGVGRAPTPPWPRPAAVEPVPVSPRRSDYALAKGERKKKP